MNEDIEKVLIAEEVIERRLDVIAERIRADFANEESLQVVGILKGALVFMADLLRRVPVRLEIECLNVASYHGGTESSGQVDFLDHKLPDVKGRSILLVDDILDTGRTLAAVSEKLYEMGAKEVKTCVLLTKDKERDAKASPACALPGPTPMPWHHALLASFAPPPDAFPLPSTKSTTSQLPPQASPDSEAMDCHTALESGPPTDPSQPDSSLLSSRSFQ